MICVKRDSFQPWLQRDRALLSVIKMYHSSNAQRQRQIFEQQILSRFAKILFSRIVVQMTTPLHTQSFQTFEEHYFRGSRSICKTMILENEALHRYYKDQKIPTNLVCLWESIERSHIYSLHTYIWCTACLRSILYLYYILLIGSSLLITNVKMT